MVRNWRSVWVAALGLGAISTIILVGLSWFVAKTSRMDIPAGTFQPLLALVTVAKKTASDVVVIKQPNQPSLTRALPPGYLVAYEQNPKVFEADARLFDMWTTAMKLSSNVVENGPTGDWVKNSLDIKNVPPKDTVDPWGHTVCLLRRGDMVLVVSGGPDAPGSPMCKDIGMTPEELGRFPNGKLLQSRSGSLVLVFAKEAFQQN